MKSHSKFIHLRNYTQYSLSKGASNDLVAKCLKNKIPAVGISILAIFWLHGVFIRM